MALIRLAFRARLRLQQLARSGAKAREVRRAQALLWLHQGDRVQQVAERLGVSRQTVYQWLAQYHQRRPAPVCQRLQDCPHWGRPPQQREAAQKIIAQLLPRDPRRYGSRALVWTVPHLCRQVQQRTGQKISQRTVRRALHQLKQCYKRPRYVLARRSPTWRQAKGGSNAA
jgi:transposase